MAITKEIIIGKIEVVTNFKHIQVRTDTQLKIQTCYPEYKFSL